MSYALFEEWDQTFKKSVKTKIKEDTLTVAEAGKMLGKSKDDMKIYVETKGLTKVKIERSITRYLLLKREIDDLLILDSRRRK